MTMPSTDSALGAIGIDSLVNIGKRLADCTPNSAVAIGASEALFMAISRRDLANTAHVPENLIIDLTRTVLSRLEPHRRSFEKENRDET